MGNEIPLQLAQFFRAILLGGSLALLYDLTRVLSTLGSRRWEAILDILLSVTAVASLFLLIMAEEGELRLFILLGTIGGAVLFFSLLSSAIRPLLAFWLDVFLLPLRLGHKFFNFLQEIFKKVFSFSRTWFTITDTPQECTVGEELYYGRQAVKTEDAPQQ